jgi:ketosteroid isomerase-like protein
VKPIIETGVFVNMRRFIAIELALIGALLAAQLLPLRCSTALAEATQKASAAAEGAAAGALSKEILDLEKSVNDAYAANDLPRYFSFYWDDLTQWFPEGRVSLAEYRKNWTAFIGAGNKIQSVKISDMRLAVSPLQDSAVATYRLDVHTKTADGKVTNEAFQETDVWFKRNGQWKIITLHYSPAGK